MFKTYLASLAVGAVLALGSAAYAQTQNNGWGADGNNQNVANGGAGGQGGAGGAGGAGGQGGAGGTGIGIGGSGGNAAAGAAAGASADATAGAAAGAVSGAAAKAGDNNVTIRDGDTDVDAEPAYAPNVTLTSNGCIGSVSGSGGGGGLISVGAGFTIIYEDCMKLEFAKFLLAAGRVDEAIKLTNSVDYVRAALSDPGHVAQVSDSGEVQQVELTSANVPYWCSTRVGSTMTATDRALCGK